MPISPHRPNPVAYRRCVDGTIPANGYTSGYSGREPDAKHCFGGDRRQIDGRPTARAKEELRMENCRTNEVLSEQIAIIQEFAQKLDTNDLSQLEANLAEIEMALNRLTEFMAYLPK